MSSAPVAEVAGNSVFNFRRLPRRSAAPNTHARSREDAGGGAVYFAMPVAEGLGGGAFSCARAAARCPTGRGRPPGRERLARRTAGQRLAGFGAARCQRFELQKRPIWPSQISAPASRRIDLAGRERSRQRARRLLDRHAQQPALVRGIWYGAVTWKNGRYGPTLGTGAPSRARR